MDDLHLIPSLTDQRKQRAAHALLGEVYAQAHRDDLPSITWSIATTGTLNGSIDPYVPADTAERIFHAWAAALGLEVVGGTPARAVGRQGEVSVQLRLPSEQETAPWR
ncbi:hypothetical protein [Actinomadura sp. 6N118]|uniref:hypothetical protein n=1 Tax=Actinomadura sp. 6N118 TaxID=3375151 RepID=UPI0037B2A4CF